MRPFTRQSNHSGSGINSNTLYSTYIQSYLPLQPLKSFGLRWTGMTSFLSSMLPVVSSQHGTSRQLKQSMQFGPHLSLSRRRVTHRVIGQAILATVHSFIVIPETEALFAQRSSGILTSQLLSQISRPKSPSTCGKRSAQVGLAFSISSIFQSRRQRFRAFSRRIALSAFS